MGKRLLTLLAIFSVVLSMPSYAVAAITLDTSGTAAVPDTTASTITLSLTLASGASLWCGVAGNNPVSSPTTVTWNTTETMTQAVTRDQTNFTSAAIYYIAAPTSGTHDVLATFVGQPGMELWCTSWTGTAASPLGATGSNGSASDSSAQIDVVTTEANSLVLDATGINGTQTISQDGTNQINRIDASLSGFRHEMSSIQTTGTGTYSIKYSWTPARVWNGVAVEIKGAADASVPANEEMIIVQ